MLLALKVVNFEEGSEKREERGEDILFRTKSLNGWRRREYHRKGEEKGNEEAPRKVWQLFANILPLHCLLSATFESQVAWQFIIESMAAIINNNSEPSKFELAAL